MQHNQIEKGKKAIEAIIVPKIEVCVDLSSIEGTPFILASIIITKLVEEGRKWEAANLLVEFRSARSHDGIVKLLKTYVNIIDTSKSE